MRRILIILALWLGSIAPAEAVTITSGHIGAWQGGDFGGAYDIHGVGYDLVSFRHGGNEPVPFSIYTSGGAYNTPRDLSNSTTLLFGPLYGELTWTIAPVSVPPRGSGPQHTVQYVSAPFSMTGVINDVPLVGAGIFSLGAFSHDTGWNVWAVNFDFGESAPIAATPEPMTLFLMGAGLFAVAQYTRRTRRASHGHPTRAP